MLAFVYFVPHTTRQTVVDTSSLKLEDLIHVYIYIYTHTSNVSDPRGRLSRVSLGALDVVKICRFGIIGILAPASLR